MLLSVRISQARRQCAQLHTTMSRRSHSPSPRLAKRPRTNFDPLTSADYKDGVMLAPMVRSGALPTRLFALKHGATLVWGPETVDKAILHTERVVDPSTGVVSYMGKSKAIFTTHPIEKPYLIYQIGSADPELAVKAAKTVVQDVAGFDLNCGCPKPFSTHSGMGAALLTNPDLLCKILTALRAALPRTHSLSAKIRLLPSQEDTLVLVGRIIGTGVDALTVHCRTRNQRMREKAHIGRLREIVEFVERVKPGVAVLENGDCEGYEHALRIREVTGAHSVMIATAAEANPTCFSTTPLIDLETTFVPSYLRLAKYLDNHWSSTKFCTTQFKGAHVNSCRADQTHLRQTLMSAKGYDELNTLVGSWTGDEEFAGIVKAIEQRGGRRAPVQVPARNTETRDEEEATESQTSSNPEDQRAELKTPQGGSLDSTAVLRAPLMPANSLRMAVPALVSREDAPTPTPSPGFNTKAEKTRRPSAA